MNSGSAPPARPRRALLVALGASLALGGPLVVGPASAATRTALTGPDDALVELDGGYDAWSGTVPIPPRWRTVGGTLRLRWRASPQLVAPSALQVRIGGRILGSVPLSPGAGGVTVRLPPQRVPRGVSSVPLTLVARMATRADRCPPPDDPSAWLQLERSSALTVDGAGSAAAPALRTLPGALLTGVGRQRSQLLIRFGSPVTPALLRAATVAAGEVDASGDARGVRIRAALPGTAVRRRPGEAAIELVAAPGPLTIRTRTVGADRSPVVRLQGPEDELLRAAGALRRSVARRLSGTVADASRLPAVTPTARPTFPRRIRLPDGSATGLDGQQVSLPFDIPVHLEALRGARLRLAATYQAPAGGQATVAINGRAIASESLHASGPSRLYVEEELAGRGPATLRADLRAGENVVTVSTRLTRPRALRCAPADAEGRLQVTDFGSVSLLTRARPVSATLSVFPFPLNRRSGWSGTTVQLPERPTEAELGAVLGTLAEARRVTGELVLPAFRLGGDVPDGSALVLARPGRVPEELVKDVPGPKDAGVLAARKDGEAVRILAIGAKALVPLANGYRVGKVRGRVVESLNADDAAIRVGDAEAVTAVQRGPVPWRWPLLIIGLAILGIAVVALRGALVRLRRRTDGAVPPSDEPGGGEGERRSD
jgi:hypothetical protein